MEGSVILFILIGAIVIWALFFRQINPSNKTDAQLMWMYDMASKNHSPLEKNENLELIQAEIEKRGLLGNKPQTSNSTHLSEEKQKKFDEVENGIQVAMQKISTSDIPEKMFNKIIDISKIKGISEHEASQYFNELFESATLKYTNKGFSPEEADEKGIKEALATEIKK